MASVAPPDSLARTALHPPTRFRLETWDAGRVTINSDFAALFQQQGLTTFTALMQQASEVAKNLRSERVTSRFTLTDATGKSRAFYIKRHSRSSLWETVKPLLRFTWPLLGARPEWNALLAFHAAGLPTMVPVAIGEQGRDSFLITAALDDCVKLSEWVPRLAASGRQNHECLRRLIHRTANLTRAMHANRLHHQDYYLGHLLHPVIDPGSEQVTEPYIIDLGRARRLRWMSRRWIVKDLAQLNYSARMLSRTDRYRFFIAYLERRPSQADRPLLHAILAKTSQIARHSRKHHYTDPATIP